MPCFRLTNVFDSCLSVLQKCVSFRKDVSNVLRVCLKVSWIVVFEKKASVFASRSQVTKSFVYPIVLKGFCYVLTPFNNFVPPLKLMDNLAFRKFIRDGRGSSYGP